MNNDPLDKLTKTVLELEVTAGRKADPGKRRGPTFRTPSRRKQARAAQKASRKRNR